jgi:predicted aspartyl protease
MKMNRWILRSITVLIGAVGLVAAAGAQEIVATAPMELQRGRPIVQVKMNGQGPFNFIIDTGTGADAVVSAELIQKLALPVIGEDEVGDPTGANQHKVPVVAISSLEFAGVQFKDVRASQLVEMHSGLNIDGIIGFLLFRDYLLSLDFPGGRVNLMRGSLPAADGNEIVRIRMPDGVPLIELNVGGKMVDAHIDTGGVGLSLPAKFVEGLTLASEPIVIGHGRTISNEFEVKGAQLASEIRLGGYTFPTPFVEINPLFPIGNFGMIPLRSFVVTFDQKNNLVRFIAAEKIIQIAAPPRRMEGAQHTESRTKP